MSNSLFEYVVAALGLAFAMAFLFIVVPPLWESKDILGAFAAGFVNSSSHSLSTNLIQSALLLVSPKACFSKSPERGLFYCIDASIEIEDIHPVGFHYAPVGSEVS